MRTIKDFKMDEQVTIMYFGQPCTMKVSGHSVEENKVKLQLLTSFGSSWYTPEEIETHQKRVADFRARQLDLFQIHNDVDVTGNSYSDADAGL